MNKLPRLIKELNLKYKSLALLKSENQSGGELLIDS